MQSDPLRSKCCLPIIVRGSNSFLRLQASCGTAMLHAGFVVCKLRRYDKDRDGEPFRDCLLNTIIEDESDLATTMQ